jgi:hypothetical protein
MRWLLHYYRPYTRDRSPPSRIGGRMPRYKRAQRTPQERMFLLLFDFSVTLIVVFFIWFFFYGPAKAHADEMPIGDADSEIVRDVHVTSSFVADRQQAIAEMVNELRLRGCEYPILLAYLKTGSVIRFISRCADPLPRGVLIRCCILQHRFSCLSW